MNSSKGTATTVADKLPAYVKKYIYSGIKSVDDDGHSEYEEVHGKKGYLPWAEDLADSKDDDDLWKYDDETYADQDAYETTGIKNLATRGKNGDDLIVNKAIPYLEEVLDGNYLEGTRTAFTTMLGNVTDKPKSTLEDILEEIGTSVYVVGDFSSSNLAKESVADTKYYNRIASLVKAQNYKSERRRQEHALSYGIEYGKQSVVDAELLRMSGLYKREYKQGKLEDAYKNKYDNLITKVRRLEILGNAVRSLVGSQEATTRPYYRPSPVVGILGGAMAGGAAGFMLGGPPGAAIGAAAGGLLGALSSM